MFSFEDDNKFCPGEYGSIQIFLKVKADGKSTGEKNGKKTTTFSALNIVKSFKIEFKSY
ncbi:hypothetical protein [Methanobacterium ferruginis]|uniref:hypothetical protein n=1 Tax=Methanobacterium ferruginis TaxID=710191 RepID=UPI0025727FD8|nr:hypothetical protein [Methanobacterium ferruginis]BDZ67647.1 hypothetical protein GCM10025860_10950 [Methanobacterium ferruginis]